MNTPYFLQYPEGSRYGHWRPVGFVVEVLSKDASVIVVA